jgi:hypothetical protein
MSSEKNSNPESNPGQPTKKLSDVLREMPSNNDRVGQSFVVIPGRRPPKPDKPKTGCQRTRETLYVHTSMEG